jgi:hypothetical protein
MKADMKKGNRNVPRDIRQVKVDVTDMCANLPPKVKRVVDVYITDISERTFICSAQAMAFMIGVRCDFVYEGELSEEEAEAISNMEIAATPEDTYMDWRNVSELPFVKFNDDPEDTDEAAMEAAREYFQGNCL